MASPERPPKRSIYDICDTTEATHTLISPNKALRTKYDSYEQQPMMRAGEPDRHSMPMQERMALWVAEDKERLNPPNKPKMFQDTCLCGNPRWEAGLDETGKRVCLNCCVESQSTEMVAQEGWVMRDKKTQEENDAAIRTQFVLDQKACAEMFKLSIAEMGNKYTPQLRRHINNRLGQVFAWAKLLQVTDALLRTPDRFFLNPSQMRELCLATRAAVKVWVHDPDRTDKKFANPSLWMIGIALTIKARDGDGKWTVPTETLRDLSCVRGLHKYLALYKSQTVYTKEEAEEQSLSSTKQPGAARDAIRYITARHTRQARLDSLGTTKKSVFNKLDALSRLLVIAKFWPNPDRNHEQKYLGLDRRVMLLHKPTLVVPPNQITPQAQEMVAIKPKAVGLKSFTGMYAKLAAPKLRVGTIARKAPAPAPAPAAATPDDDDTWDSHSDDGEEEEAEEAQAARIKAERERTAQAAKAKEERLTAWQRQQVEALEGSNIADAQQASMQEVHAQAVQALAATASQESNQETATEPLYSDAEDEDAASASASAPASVAASPPAPQPAPLPSLAGVMPEDVQLKRQRGIVVLAPGVPPAPLAPVAPLALTTPLAPFTSLTPFTSTPAPAPAAAPAELAMPTLTRTYNGPPPTEWAFGDDAPPPATADAGAASSSAAPPVYSEAEDDDDADDSESVAAASDAVGDYDSEKDALPEDLDLEDDAVDAKLRAAAAAADVAVEAVKAGEPTDEDLFASALAAVESTPAAEMPLGLAVNPLLPEASRKRVNADGDIDVLAGLRWYKSTEDWAVARLTKTQATDSANYRQGGAKAQRFLDRYIRLSTKYRATVRAKLEKENKLKAAKEAAAAKRAADAEAAAAKRASLSKAVLERKSDRQYKAMLKAKETAQKAAAKGDANVCYFEPTKELGGAQKLVYVAPQVPKINMDPSTKRYQKMMAKLAADAKKKAKSNEDDDDEPLSGRGIRRE